MSLIGWMRVSANPEGQRGVGAKKHNVLENAKNTSIHISHSQGLQNRQDSCDTAKWTGTLQCTKIVCVCSNASNTVLLFIGLLVFPWGSKVLVI